MAILVNNRRLPYVDLRYDYAHNPASFTYAASDRHYGGIKVRRKRVESKPIPLPIVVSRRGHEDKDWYEIIEEITDIIFVDEMKEYAFTDYRTDRYYLAHAIEFNITEEHEYVSKGELVLMPEKNVMYGNNKGVTFKASKVVTVLGQEPANWSALVTFSGPASRYELTVGDNNIVLNFDFVANDSLVIDYAKRSATLNGKNIDTAIDIRSEWSRLTTGDITAKATESTTLSYREEFY